MGGHAHFEVVIGGWCWQRDDMDCGVVIVVGEVCGSVRKHKKHENTPINMCFVLKKSIS